MKPLFYHASDDGSFYLSSEIKGLHAAGVKALPDESTWSTYLAFGLYDHGPATFWNGVQSVPAGGVLTWDVERGVQIESWYDPLFAAVEDLDERSDDEVAEELLALLEDSIRLRFRADVPVGVCLSGGLDSCLLLGLINRVKGKDFAVEAFSFDCGDERYDETPWIEKMLESTKHPWHLCRLDADSIPRRAAALQRYEDEPFGGFPTMGMSCVHEKARERGITVLLDGNGVDEGWAGYDYYARAGEVDSSRGPVQGTAASASSQPDYLQEDFACQAVAWKMPNTAEDPLRNLQYRDVRYAKIPRALRFNDRVSMMYSRELREPFLDHRLVELGLRQPASRKIRDGQGKWLVREVARKIIPSSVSFAPKRPVQTPQREWLRGPLAGWVRDQVQAAADGWGGAWLDRKAAMAYAEHFIEHGGDNSFPLWQLVNLGLVSGAVEVHHT